MGLSVSLMETWPVEVYWKHISHNYRELAIKARVYHALWRPGEVGVSKAYELVGMLERGLARLRTHKEKASEQSLGSYDVLIDFVEAYLQACRENPDADISVSR